MQWLPSKESDGVGRKDRRERSWGLSQEETKKSMAKRKTKRKALSNIRSDFSHNGRFSAQLCNFAVQFSNVDW